METDSCGMQKASPGLFRSVLISLPPEEQRVWVTYVNRLFKARYDELFENNEFTSLDLDELLASLEEKFRRCEELGSVRGY